MERLEKIAKLRGYAVTEEGQMLNPGGKEIGKTINNNGYRTTHIKVNKKGVKLSVHRLQAYQKYGNTLYGEGIQVRHKDGDPLNNSWDNILIGTGSQNMMDIPEQIRIRKAKYASSFNQKYNKKEVKNYYNSCRSYNKTMQAFGISSKGTLHYIINN